MKTRLIQIATLLMLLGTGLAGAAEVTQAVQAAAPATVQADHAVHHAWQRVGSPQTLTG